MQENMMKMAKLLLLNTQNLRNHQARLTQSWLRPAEHSGQMVQGGCQEIYRDEGQDEIARHL
eukprot:3473346-Karenia_brevis.AAC.1